MALNSALQHREGAVNEDKSAGTFDHRPSEDMATIHDDDERLLARIGYRQVSISPS